ncbi:MAG TPA: hypothetical protein ENN65_01945 [Candidatus Hydrogenedentes bacterium]|nr:hypothetical protein [Candidatus Hydrogenedentota bacterium]
MTDEQKAQLHEALVEMGAASMAQESEVLRDHVMNEAADISGRMAVLEAFFAEYPFTGHHASNLGAHLLYGTAEQERMGRFVGAFAATAVRVFWENPTAHQYLPSLYVFPFLETMYNHSSEAMRKAAATGIHDALNGKPSAVGLHFAGDGSSPIEIQIEAMQTCITLGAFAKGRTIKDWLDVPPSTAAMADASGIWLFDGGALGEDHLRCLKSIFNAIPGEQHGIAAMFVPDATSFSAETNPLRLPGFAFDIPLFPMDMLRDLSEMPPHLDIPPVPEFALVVLEQVMYGVQRLAQQYRPLLFQRRDALLRQIALLPTSPLDTLAPPEIVRGPPDALTAYLGVLWLVNAQALVESAVYLMEAYQTREPLYLLLMLADMFSGGGEATTLYRTAPSGQFSGTKTALRRAFLSPTDNYVNGIAVGGRLWQYNFDDLARLL